ncbi:ABC transporter permease [Streptomyces sp. N2-109]|uniref:ABC transporter permease n=1 Tax=Streptomyces gossypii TaxID=2883101 RepID=A0ABT2JRJ1_9ACTN|nr:FtsX-like permease family protein [Streptomyces gossypii]MCT2590511.1 ABC transporter permease [Streptomyces gossypii]
MTRRTDLRRGRGLAAAWTWTRLRAAPGAALAFAALLMVTAFTAAALPRLIDGYENDALRESVAEAPLRDQLVSGTAEAVYGGPETDPRELVLPPALDRSAEAFRRAVRPPLPADRDGAVYGVHNRKPAAAIDPGFPRPSPQLTPRTSLVAQPDLARHSRLVEGRMPGGRLTGPPGERHVEAVLTPATAHRMKLRTGDTFRLAGLSGETTVKVTGLISPRSPGDVYWKAEPSLDRPTLKSLKPPGPGSEPEHYWHFSAFIDRQATAALLDLKDGAELFWHQQLRTGGIQAHQVAELRDTLTSLTVGRDATRLEQAAAVGPITFNEGLVELLASFERERSAVAPLLLMATLGLATAAVTVLLLWGVLAAARREAELALWRSRGSSLRGLAGRLLAETAAVGLPAAALGTATALLITPAGRWSQALPAAAVVTAVALFTLPVRAALTHRRPQVPSQRSDMLRGRRSRRRTVVEVTVLTLVVGTLVALRRRGTGGGGEDGGSPDPMLSAAPVLLALAVALVLVRLYPLPLRLLSRPAARRRGPVAFLGMARAARAPSAAVAGLPLLTMLVALTVAAFGGTVLAGIADGREAAALRAVGADARLDSPEQLSGKVLAQVRKADGVADVSEIRVFHGGDVVDSSSGVTAGSGVTVVIAEPRAYARLAERTGFGAFAERALRPGKGAGGPDQALPALVSAPLAEKMADRASVSVPGLELTVHAEVVRQSTPAVRGADFLVLSRAAVERTRPDTADSALVSPNSLLLSGSSLDSAALRELVPDKGSDLTLNLRTEQRDSYSDSVLQSGAERLYVGAVLAAAGFSALAVLLSLLQTAPERITLLARLRTMGLPRRQGRWLLLIESLPMYVLAAVAGVLTALASVPLLRPGIDLTTLAGTPAADPVHLATDPLSLALPALCLLILACAALLVQARIAGRTTDLRMEPL